MSKPIIQFDMFGNIINTYPSINEVRRKGYNCGHICSCCQGKRKTHKGYIWKYLDEKV